MTDWQIYPLTYADQQQHIERSEQFLNTIEPGNSPLLYWSQAQPSALVLGFSQRESVLNPSAHAMGSLPIYTRRAGGSAVLVGPHLLDLDVILPPDSPLVSADIVESYRWFGEAWVAALRLLDVQTRTVSPAEAHALQAQRKGPQTREYESLLARACYGSLSPYEVVAGVQKVVGLCMIRRRRGLLLQAGVILHWETEQLASLLGHTEAEQELLRHGLRQRAVGLDTLARRVISNTEVIRAFEQVVCSDRFSHATTR